MRLGHRIIALLLWLAYAGNFALPALMTAVACLDGGHDVVVVEAEHGLEVRLRHDEGHLYTPDVADHERLLTRALVTLCSSTQEGDHNLSVGDAGAGLLSARDKDKQAREPAHRLNAEATFRLRASLMVRAAEQIHVGRIEDTPGRLCGRVGAVVPQPLLL